MKQTSTLKLLRTLQTLKSVLQISYAMLCLVLQYSIVLSVLSHGILYFIFGRHVFKAFLMIMRYEKITAAENMFAGIFVLIHPETLLPSPMDMSGLRPVSSGVTE